MDFAQPANQTRFASILPMHDTAASKSICARLAARHNPAACLWV